MPVVDAETARALRETAEKPEGGYQILTDDAGHLVVAMIFDEEVAQYRMSLAAAKRLAKRLLIAVERARRCQASKSSAGR